MQRLKDQVAIVTGGASGIGGATCRRLAEDGAKVLIADIDVPAAEANAAKIRDAGGTAEVLKADVGSHDDIRNMVRTAVDRWGRLDILVNNAYSPAHGAGGSALDVTEEAWDIGMSLLVKSIFLGTKYAVPEMQKIGGGNIVNIASVHGLLMAPERLVYEAGKSAVIGMTKQMATDFGPMGIRVNAICPGHIVTERLEEQWAGNPTGLQFFEDQYPLRKVGRPVDIGNSIAFLCSDEASFITGHALVVDGGLTVQLQEDFGVRQAHYLTQNPDTQMPF
ncbi:MAG: SDR family oxidoreductase [Chloroflexi bacterium]|nr:SDR family oxidoreductase [Chloroflexota bacterium]MDA1228513.1 SDR family oxidoreductase [Chloroflexota bacterium]